MVFKTYRAALASLREFTPEVRARHSIVKFWSNQDNDYRFTRVFK